MSASLTDTEAAQRAVAVLRDLAAQSRSYAGIAWAVGVYESNDQKWFYATSNEGMSYLPPGVRWDPQVLLVFDAAAPEAGWLPWRGLANPARIVLDHFLLLRKSLPDMRLVSLVSTAPRGEEVDGAAARFGTVRLPEAAGSGQIGLSEYSLPRLEAVDRALYQQVIAQISLQDRWPVAIALAEDALRVALGHDGEASRSEPELDLGFDALRSGRGVVEALGRIEAAGREFAERAQAKRVPDQRLDPVDSAAELGTWADVATIGEPFAYAGPFWRARVATMLAMLLRARADDAFLSKEHVAELAYEHYCVAEDPRATTELLLGILGAGAAV